MGVTFQIMRILLYNNIPLFHFSIIPCAGRKLADKNLLDFI
jgi:hypothetical protein